MAGDILAWIFGAATVLLLAVAERRRARMRGEYHRELIREFFPEGDEE